MAGGDGARPGPRRTCIGCRRVAPAAELIRVARGTEGDLVVARHAPGRGAWLCGDPGCLVLARRRRAFPKALRAPVTDAALDRLQAELAP